MTENTHTIAGMTPVKQGKVREIYACGDALLIVATDRISAYDVILPTPIPEKGKILTEMSCFWFSFVKDRVPTHFITADVEEYPLINTSSRAAIEGRSMLVRKADVVPVECVVRGYLAGSAWTEYCESGTIGGQSAPSGLRESSQLPSPLFTPTTKAAHGHDMPMTFDEVCAEIGAETAEKIRAYACDIYTRAAAYAYERGIIIADTKFEFGFVAGELTLVDEVLTPDSSRFWPVDGYEPGRPQASYDKQFVRDYLRESGWDMQPPAPALPDDVVTRTCEKYCAARRCLCGA